MDRQTFLVVLVTFLLTTLFWFSVPTVSMIIQGQEPSSNVPSMDEIQAKIDAANKEIAEQREALNKERAEMEKTIRKKYEAKAKTATTAKPSNEGATSEPTSSEATKELSIVGTWVFANPQTTEEREFQLIFSEYGIFKYYNKYYGITMQEETYSAKDGQLQIDRDLGTFRLSNNKGVDYLEITGFKSYSGKLKRLR